MRTTNSLIRHLRVSLTTYKEKNKDRRKICVKGHHKEGTLTEVSLALYFRECVLCVKSNLFHAKKP